MKRGFYQGIFVWNGGQAESLPKEIAFMMRFNQAQNGGVFVRIMPGWVRD